MRDALGRTIDYLRLSLTDRCNLRCIYCMPKQGVVSLPHDDILRLEEFARIVRVAAKLGVCYVRLTGGEPLVRKGLVGLVNEVAHTPGIKRIALTTNATLLAGAASDLAAAGLSRVNISLDSLDPCQYRTITRRGTLDDALAGIDAALSFGLNPVKLNVVVMRSLEQDLLEFARLTLNRPLHVRFIEYMPVGDTAEDTGSGWGPEDVVRSQEILKAIDAGARAVGLGGLERVQQSGPEGWGPARYWRLSGARGTIGVISALSNHFCGTCNRLRVTADGRLRPCLFSDLEYDLRTAVRSGDDTAIESVFHEALNHKPTAHNGRIGTQRRMSQVGG